jgi:hypothetical protein
MTFNKQAIVSGALGATASCIAKLALAPDSPVPSTVHAICIANINANNMDNLKLCTFIALLARGGCFVCMMGVNASMIYLFVDGMSESGSVVGTALSTAANFSFSVRKTTHNIAVRHSANFQFNMQCIVYPHTLHSIKQRFQNNRPCMAYYFSKNMFQYLGTSEQH